MSRDRTAKAELLATLAKLRWELTSLHWAGIEDWPLAARLAVSPACRSPAGRQPAPQEGPKTGSLPVADTREASPNGAPEEACTDPESTLRAVQEELGNCTRCRLHETRNRIVFGEGSPRARLVFVGEGPGYEEDQQGRPFVGKAGQLLDKMIKALGFGREQVYICNMVKCRPPNNRTPNSDEIEACSPFLVRQIEAIRPRVICALGACAAQSLLGSASSISRLRGKTHHWRGIPLVATFHPAYLLRNPAQKAAAWQDLLELRQILDR